MNFVKDPTTLSYERSVFSFLDLAGNLGGFFEILERTGAFLVGFFAGPMFMYSILSSLYQVDTHKKGKSFSELYRSTRQQQS